MTRYVMKATLAPGELAELVWEDGELSGDSELLAAYTRDEGRHYTWLEPSAVKLDKAHAVSVHSWLVAEYAPVTCWPEAPPMPGYVFDPDVIY